MTRQTLVAVSVAVALVLIALATTTYATSMMTAQHMNATNQTHTEDQCEGIMHNESMEQCDSTMHDGSIDACESTIDGMHTTDSGHHASMMGGPSYDWSIDSDHTTQEETQGGCH